MDKKLTDEKIVKETKHCMTENNNRFLQFIYELDSLDECDKDECWLDVNPSLS